MATLYTHIALIGVVSTWGRSHANVRRALVRTEAPREARNAVHHGTSAQLPATWETAAAFLMGAVPNLRLLWGCPKSRHPLGATDLTMRAKVSRTLVAEGLREAWDCVLYGLQVPRPRTRKADIPPRVRSCSSAAQLP